MLKRIVSALQNAHEANTNVTADFTHTNLKRIFPASICCLFLNVASIVLLLSLPIQNAVWQAHQVLINVGMMAFVLLLLYPIWTATKKESNGLFARLLPYIGFVFLMASGIVSAANDHLTNSSVTTYIMICLANGTLFLIRPLHSLLLYLASFTVLVFVNTGSPASEAVKAANLVNAFAMTGLSTFLSMMLWHNSRTNILQSYQIHAQQKLLEKNNMNLHKMAYYDALTDLPNRRYLNDILQKETALMARKNYESCLIMLDIDYFKYVNDYHGHPVGDKLLIEISSLLAQNIRKYDTLCRLGGEEFMILLPQTTLEEAVAVANKLLNAISSEPFVIDSKTVSITTSIGVSRLMKDADASLIEHYTCVDKALYKAKRDGRNCVRTA